VGIMAAVIFGNLADYQGDYDPRRIRFDDSLLDANS